MKTQLFSKKNKLFIIAFFCLSITFSQTITGELKKHHKTTLTFNGLSLTESPATSLNYRMNVTFIAPSSKTYIVPGYFAADGNASETSANSGNKWRCHINADEIGIWNYTVSFKTGTNIAVSLNPSDGTSASFNGASGNFTISETDKTGDDFRGKGKLQYVGETFAKFNNGDYFFEFGADSPETFLEYADFDATTARHDFSEVASNYNAGDPSWQSGKGTEIIGAVNYLASQGMNVNYFLTMNITGDGKRAYPFPNKSAYTTYDVSKLDQWQIVFDHMYNKGMIQEIVFTEDENNNWFEDQEGIPITSFSNSRKLYYREIIARFGYLNLVYNIGEEANWQHSGAGSDFYTAAQIEEAAVYLQAISPYNDLISVHNGPSNDFSLFPRLTALPGTSALTSISHQWRYNKGSKIHTNFLNLNTLAVADGTKWVSRLSEPYSGSLPNLNNWTDNSLWASITAGSAGIHYYSHNGDIGKDDYTAYSSYYNRMKIAKDFFSDNNIPFWTFENKNAAIASGTGYLLTDESDYYVAFLPQGGTISVDISGTGNFDVRWYNPRTGGVLQQGSVTNVTAGNNRSMGNPPSQNSSSWVLFLENTSQILSTENEISDALEKTKISISNNRTLEIINIPTEKATIKLFDLLGKEVFTKIFKVDNINKFRLPNNLSRTIYLVRLETVKGIKSKKVFIE